MRFHSRLLFLAWVGVAALAACSGSFGSGSNLPQTLGSMSPTAPTATPTPNSQSVVLTVGESTAFQTIPEVGGYGAQIAFPKVTPEPAKAAKDAKSPAPAATPVAIAIGATLSVVKPEDGPDLNFESGKGRKKKSREHPARALAYIKLLPTHDLTLESYPRITLDIPRDIATQYRDGEFGLALWNSGEKDGKYRLAVAELDKTTTPPPMAVVTRPSAAATSASSGAPSAAPSATAAATTRSLPGLGGTAPVAGPSGAASGAPGVAATAAPTLPPARILFSGTASTLKLIANRPAVFAIYALPHPASSASPVPAKAGASAEKSPAHVASPSASATAAAASSPAASPAASATP